MFKKLAFVCALALPISAAADDHQESKESKKAEKEYQELLEKSPFNKMYPKQIAPGAAEYFGVFNSLFS